MSIPTQDVFSQVVESILLSLLILFPFDIGVLYLLDVKGSNFYSYAFDGEDSANLIDETMVRI